MDPRTPASLDTPTRGRARARNALCGPALELDDQLFSSPERATCCTRSDAPGRGTVSTGDDVMAHAVGCCGSTSVRRERQRRIRPLPSGVLQVQVSHRNSLTHVHNRAVFTADVAWACDADCRGARSFICLQMRLFLRLARSSMQPQKPVPRFTECLHVDSRNKPTSVFALDCMQIRTVMALATGCNGMSSGRALVWNASWNETTVIDAPVGYTGEVSDTIVADRGRGD